MAKSQLAAALAVAACCLLSAPGVHGQNQRLDQQRGGQNTGAFSRGQQGGAAIGQQRGAFGGGQQGPGRGQQFGPGQRPGFGQGNAGQGGFVGSDAQDMRQGFENMSGRQRRGMMFDMMVENLNEMRDQRRQRQQRRRRPDSIRVQLRPSFSYAPLESRHVAVTLQNHLARSADLTGIVAPRVELVGRTATVSGFVPSEHERAVIARMIALQPGVSEVENLLSVDPFAPTAGEDSAESPAEEPATKSALD